MHMNTYKNDVAAVLFVAALALAVPLIGVAAYAIVRLFI